jgi:UDP-N-acetylmuramoyl-tripeptide--D-alanyl-D-alanine ligase
MMGALSLQDLAVELDAAYAGPALDIARVATDSRAIATGDLYVALRGERFDGHDFIEAAARDGAVAAVVDIAAAAQSSSIPRLGVSDTRAALGLIARMNRRRFQGPVVAVTGSAGKTTCKEMLAAIFGQCGATLATRGNLNNEIGVPLTLLNLAPEHRYAVIEMGAARAGDIAYLCRFAEPDVAIVTTALPVHLEGFGDIDTVANTKGEIFGGARGNGIAIINIDSEYAARWQQMAGARRLVTFGLSAAAQVGARAIARSAAGVNFELVHGAQSISIALPLLGAHNVRNALAAAAAALALDVPLAAIRAGLESLQPAPGRLQSRRGSTGGIVIDDSYNSNPEAAKAAIDVLGEYTGRRRLLLGNMGELGPRAEQFHCDVARYAALSGIEQCWFVGPHAPAQVEEFARHGAAVKASAFADNAAAIVACQADPAVDAILIKGSRSAGMEAIVAALCGPAINGEGH